MPTQQINHDVLQVCKCIEVMVMVVCHLPTNLMALINMMFGTAT